MSLSAFSVRLIHLVQTNKEELMGILPKIAVCGYFGPNHVNNCWM
jgi:hypothetical protein